MGLMSLTWVVCHNVVKIHLVVIEILSFSCFVLFLLTGRWRPSCSAKCKKSKWLNAKIIVIRSWYNSIEKFYTMIFLVRDAILTGPF